MKFYRLITLLLVFALTLTMFAGISVSAADDSIKWSISFAKNVDGAFEAVTSVEPGEEFYIAVGIEDYDSLGDIVYAYDEDEVIDYTATAYNNVISCATIFIDCAVDAEIDTTNIVSPYDLATFETNYKDDQLRVIMWADKSSGGLDYSIGNEELTANDGVLFYVKAVAGEEGALSYNFNKGSSSAATSIATINKVAGVTFNALTHVSSVPMTGYDDIYTLNVGEEIPVGPTYVEGLKIAGKNVAFAADYTMVFAVSKANYEAYEQVYLEVQKKLYEGDVEFETATLTETEMLNGMYAFRYKNFAAREIASEVQATVYAKDADGNVFYGPTLTYSMREYAENQIGKTTNAYFKVMMVDFLNYGAAAQNHFAYNKDDLANKNIDAYQGLATKDVTIEDEKGGHTDTSYEIDVTNFNLIFKSKITMVFATGMTDAEQAAYAAAGAYAKVTYTNFEGEAMAVEIALDDATNVVKQSGKWCVMYDGMKAREMDTIVTVAIYDADGNQISNQVTYSVNSYVYSKLNNSSTTLVALVNAMARFGYANQQYNLNK